MRWLILFLIVFWPFAALADDEPRLIVVQSTGTVSAAPDMAVVRLGVSHEARTASEAMAQANAAAARVLEKLASAGIEPRDVQTSSLNLYPVRDQTGNRPPQIRGYVASNDLTVRVRDVDALGGLLDSVISEGANTLNSLSFAIADTSPLETEARAKAVREARAMAETLADAAGVTLGPVASISEGGGGMQPGPMMQSDMRLESAVPVASGELDVTVSVTVAFAIE